MKNLIPNLILFFGLMVFGSITVSGSTITPLFTSETKKIENLHFHSIFIDGDFDITLLQEETSSITYDSPIFEKNDFEYRINNGVLVLKSSSKNKISRQKLRIAVENISEIEIHGNTKLRTPYTIKLDDLRINSNSSETVQLQVQSDRIDALVVNAGDLYLDGHINVLDYENIGLGSLTGENILIEHFNILEGNKKCLNLQFRENPKDKTTALVQRP
ncbi:MAG: DUF2807 domain-containing protein [Saprospiraceae bacterium]|jgi:hypothetical protein|nr:DUF2807 domain-containing protein [Saprospiraceae bacterium]